MADDVGLLSPASVNSSTGLLSPAPDSGGSSTPGTLLATLGTPPPTTAGSGAQDADALMQHLDEDGNDVIDLGELEVRSCCLLRFLLHSIHVRN